MAKSTVVPFEQPSQFSPDPLTEVIQHRARERLRTAIQAEHWKHIRTTNSIGSVYATVRNRTRKTKGCLNRKTALSMVFKLMMFQEIPLHVNWIKDEGFLASDAPGSTGLYAQIYWSEHAVRIGQSSNMAIRSALAGRV